MRTIDKFVVAICCTIIILTIGFALIGTREEPIDWSAMYKGISQAGLASPDQKSDSIKNNQVVDNSENVWVQNAALFHLELRSPYFEPKYEGKSITIDHFKYSEQVETDAKGNVIYFPLLIHD